MTYVLLAVLFLLTGIAHAQTCFGKGGNDICESVPRGLQPVKPPAKSEVRKLAQRSSKIQSAISAAMSSMEAEGLTGLAANLGGLSTRAARADARGTIQVYVILTAFRPEYVAQLEALGLSVEITLPGFRLVQGWLPAGSVDAVAALDFVLQIKPPGYPVRKSVGAVTTAGDALLGAAAARAQFNVDGAGVTVGVLTDGVAHLADSVASGDLPSDVQVLKAGSGDEGTAILEIVHDIAPGAGLAFYSPSTSADMVAGIASLRGAGARIVMDDLTFLDEPKFEDGMIAQAARSFATDGRLYVTAAGNSGQMHYRSDYRPLTGQDFPRTAYPAVHNYVSSAIDVGNTLVIPSGCNITVILQWNNRFGAANDDFDLVLARADNFALLAVGADVQDGTQDPYERVDFTNRTGAPITAFISVAEFALKSPPTSLILDYFVYADCNLSLQYVTTADSVIGHEAVNEVLSVAALGAAAPDQVEVYSSHGPGSVSFPAPEARTVPNISGIDCVATQVSELGFFVNPFCGTSAAAPHVTGVAALLMQRSPELSSERYRAILTGSAADLGPPSFDFAYGFGRIDAVAALAAAPGAPQISLGLSITPHAVAANDRVHVSVTLSNGGGEAQQDFYLAALVPPAVSTAMGCPAGDALVFFGDGLASVKTVCWSTASPQTYVPLFRNVTLAGGLPSFQVPNLLTLTWPPGSVGGVYTFLIFSTPPDAFADGERGPADITAIAEDSFTAAP